MNEGKLPINELNKLLEYKGHENDGIITAGVVGADVAVINVEKAKQIAQKFYDNYSTVHLVEKSDPITFPTPNPGKYSVIVNTNDMACAGALPYGFLITIIAPPKTSFDKIEEVQKQAHIICRELGIAIVGGHTELSSSVNSLIVAGHMIGFVPSDYLVPNKLSHGDIIIVAGYAGAEGTGIIIEEGKEKIKKILTPEEIEEGRKIGQNISIYEISLDLNRKFKPSLLHDTTEGGVYGALYELFAFKKVGIQINKEPILSPVTLKLSNKLKFNPYRLISSGGIIIGIKKEKMHKISEYLAKKKVPYQIIGEVNKEEGIVRKNKEIITEPKGDDIIIALKNLEHMRG